MANQERRYLEEQKGLEADLRQQLLQDPSEQNFQAAYDKLHRFFIEQGDKEELYPRDLRWFSRIFIDRIKSGRKVLDIGSGNGKLAIELAGNNNDVTGIDISRIAVETANEKLKKLPNYRELRVTFQYGDARNLDFPENEFDFVVSHDLVEHISEEDFIKHLAAVELVLKPGGKYMFWTPSRLRGPTSLGLHLKEYTIRELHNILKETNFKYSWIDLRFYLLKLNFEVPQTWLFIVIVYEAIVGLLIKLTPKALKKLLVPPILFTMTK